MTEVLVALVIIAIVGSALLFFLQRAGQYAYPVQRVKVNQKVDSLFLAIQANQYAPPQQEINNIQYNIKIESLLDENQKENTSLKKIQIQAWKEQKLLLSREQIIIDEK